SVRARAAAGGSRLPAAHPQRPACPPPLVPAAGSCGAARSGRVSPERSRARVAAVVLPLEQHPRRAAARRGRARAAVECRRPRAAGPAHAGRPARDARAGRQLRGPVAEPAPRPRGDRRPGHLRRLRRQPAAGLPRGDEAVSRQHACRGSQRPRPAARQLHVRQRTAGEALRHSRDLRQSLPARDAAEPRSAWRAARQRIDPRDHLVSEPDVARAARQVAARQHARHAAATAAAGREHHAGRAEGRRAAADHPRAAGAAQHQRRLLDLSCGHRSARVRARELRRDRRLAEHRRIGQAGRCERHHGQRRNGARPVRAARAAARGPGAVPPNRHREALRLRARPPSRVLRSSRGPPDRPRRGCRQLPVVVARDGNREEPGVPDAGTAARYKLRRRSPDTGHGDTETLLVMSFLTAKSLPRRTVLRGLGATIALPFLDAMLPAASARAKAAAAPVHRFQTFYVPNGMAMEYWTPKGEGSAFELSPVLEPLAPFRDRLLVLSGLKANWNYIHAGASGSFLTGTTRGGRTEVEIFADVSMDQLLARHFASDTQVASLELAMDPPNNAGACTGNLSCVYTHTLCWRNATQPLPMEYNPRAVFEKLFGDTGSTEAAAREKRLREQKSILDSVTEKLAALRRQLGADDQAKVTQYTESVRDVERRIAKAEQQTGLELPSLEQPQGVPPVFEDHLALMMDLQLLALQSDLTRVISFMIGKEQSARPYPQIGVPEAHHPLSHHSNVPELIERMSKINRYHTELFSKYVARLRATPDGDGSLLDHMTILYGAGISNSNAHSGDNLPILVVGGGAGKLKGGRHL